MKLAVEETLYIHNSNLIKLVHFKWNDLRDCYLQNLYVWKIAKTNGCEGNNLQKKKKKSCQVPKKIILK